MITLPLALEDGIRTHSELEYPYESCGLVLGNFENGVKVGKELYRLGNTRESEAKRTRFEIDPSEMVRGELYARRNGLDVVGIYHSHPDHPSVPSEFDRSHAWPGYSYLILSVGHGFSVRLQSWELDPETKQFEEEKLVLNS